MNSSFMEKLAYFESLQNKNLTISKTPINSTNICYDENCIDTINQTDISIPMNLVDETDTPISIGIVNQNDISMPMDIVDETDISISTGITNRTDISIPMDMVDEPDMPILVDKRNQGDIIIQSKDDLYCFTEDEPYIVSPPFKRKTKLQMRKRPLPPIRKKKLNHYYCSRCKIVFSHEDSYNEHLLTHKNQENDMCICNKCKRVFSDDIDYSTHLSGCTESDAADIPSDPLGKYNCPLCENKYSNSFLLGEHFVISHTEYEVLTTLDEKQWNGFPGFDILEKINMIEYTEILEDKCEICFYNFDDKNTENKEVDNRLPLSLKCCSKLICCDCLRNHLSITNSVICPYCTKDHTQNDIEYIIFIEEDNNIDKTRWDSWWIDHIDIFTPKIF